MNSNRSTSEPRSEARPPLDVNKLVDRYIKLRDRKRQIEERHKTEIAPYTKVMGELESIMLEHMQAAGIDSVATPGGTAYQSTTPRAAIKDRSAFRDWVITNRQFDMVDWKANPREVFQFIDANNGAPPPGVNASTFTAVRFRRPGEED